MATPGYIPYGLRTGDRVIDDMLSARGRLRNARIREASSVGEGLSQGVTDLIGAAAMTQQSLQDTTTERAKLSADMKARRITSENKIQELDAYIEAMESAMKGMSPEARLAYIGTLNSLKSQRASYQSAIDSYSDIKIAEIEKQQKTSMLDRIFGRKPEEETAVVETATVATTPLQAAANAKLQERKRKLKAMKDFQQNRKLKTAQAKREYNPFTDMSTVYGMSLMDETSYEE